MKKIVLTTLIMVFCSVITSFTQDPTSNYTSEINKALQAKKYFLNADPGLQKFFDESYGYTILPNVGKGGLIVGGAHGKGILFKKDVPVGSTEMSQLTIGGQIGGKSYTEVIFFNSKAEFDVFITGRYKVAVSLAAVALDKGVSNDLAFSDGVAIVTKDNKGLMAEATIGGQKFEYSSFD